jgi:hypothetical protein
MFTEKETEIGRSEVVTAVLFEVQFFLGRYAAWTGTQLLTFAGMVVPPSSGSTAASHLGLLKTEDEGTTILVNVGNQSTRLQSSDPTFNLQQ